jgi:hypothetical protein
MKDAGRWARSSNFVILGRPFTSLRGDRRPDLVGTNVHDFSISLARFNFPSTLVIASIFQVAPVRSLSASTERFNCVSYATWPDFPR